MREFAARTDRTRARRTLIRPSGTFSRGEKEESRTAHNVAVLLPPGEGGAKRRMREFAARTDRTRARRTLIRPSGTFSRGEKEESRTAHNVAVLLPPGEGGAKRRMREFAARTDRTRARRTLIRPSGTFSRGEKEHQNHFRSSPGPSTLLTQRPQISGCSACAPTSARWCQQRMHFGLALTTADTASPPCTTVTSPLMK